MNYFDFVSRGTSWELLSSTLGQGESGAYPAAEGMARAEAVATPGTPGGGASDYEVTEIELTDKQIEAFRQWTRKLSDLSAARSAASSEA